MAPSPGRFVDGAARVLLFALAALAALALAQERDLSITVFRARGPFVAETPGTRALRLSLRPGPLPGKLLSGTSLRFFVNGAEIGPGDRGLESIRRRGGGRFRHSGEDLVFSLPEGVANGPDTGLTAAYPLHLTPLGRALLALVAVGGGLLLVLPGLRRGRHRRLVEGVAGVVRRTAASIERRAGGVLGLPWVIRAAQRGLSTVNAVLLGVLVLTAAMAFAFLATTVYGVWRGFALPNTAVFTLVPVARALARQEQSFAYAFLSFGCVGAAVSWISSASAALRTRQRAQEGTITRAWQWTAPGIVLATYLFAVAGPWAGISRAGEYGAISLGGLVPFSDAGGHYGGPLRQVMAGTYDSFVERRPIAAATRSALALLAGYSAVGTLLLQAIALALTTTAAALALARWRGVWASVTFFGLVYKFSRPYVSSYLTESLGISWALAGLPFLVTALRTGSVVGELTFLLATVLSLLTRMGSLFTVPAVVAWMLWKKLRKPGALVRVVSVGLVLASCAGVNAAIRAMYGSGTGATGANFSYSLCGLTHGGIWSTCETLYAKELSAARSEAEGAEIRLEKAREMFTRRPGVLIGRLAEGEAYFLGHLVDVAVRGYDTGYFDLPPPGWFPAKLWLAVAAAGCVFVWLRRQEPGERGFWVLMAVGLLASAPWVIFDEGWRVLSGSYPLMALFLASGFSSPTAPVVAHPRGTRPLAPLVLCATVLALPVVPRIAHGLDLIHGRGLAGLALEPGEVWILGGARAAGLLVVPDGKALPVEVPSMHFGDFEEAIDASSVETYERFLYPELRSGEFGLVASVGSVAGPIFVTPPDVVRLRDVSAWRLTIDPSYPPAEKLEQRPIGGPAPGLVPLPARSYFFFVTRAVPERPGRRRP